MAIKRVFLSFADEDTQKVKDLLFSLASPEYDLDFYLGPLDMDIDAPGAEVIKRAIGEKIVKCDVVVCLISENTHNSKWVDSQLQKNLNKGNIIIAMALKGTQDAVLPAVIREKNLTFYPWDPQRLKELIVKDTRKLFNNSL
jgi:hypothetical protein